jgi:hypothetical protein
MGGGAGSMNFFEAHSDIHPSEKSVHLLAVSSEKKLFFTKFRQASSLHIFLDALENHDWI